MAYINMYTACIHILLLGLKPLIHLDRRFENLSLHLCTGRNAPPSPTCRHHCAHVLLIYCLLQGTNEDSKSVLCRFHSIHKRLLLLYHSFVS
jgi:hypothetical protein